MSKKREKLARFGIGTKGFVYCMLGGLTALTVIGMGGEKVGKDGLLQYLANQQFGNILLWLTGIGLFCFALWRLYRAFFEEHDDDNKGKEAVRRIAYVLSALVYGSMGFTAIKIVTDNGSGQGESSWMQSILELSYGKWLLVLVGLILFGKAIYEVYRAYSGKYKEKLSRTDLDSDIRDTLLETGKVGHTARGLVIGIIAFLTVRAALNYQASSAGTGDAFSFMQNNFGPIIMGIVALGLFCYGIFQFVRARYEPLSI